MEKYALTIYRYAIVVCRNPKGKFLCVQQNLNRGWWIPGGKVSLHETFTEAALRQCKQQTGLDVNIKGIIRIDTGKFYTQNILRCIFYAEPTSTNQQLKRVPDNHTSKAQFLSLNEIESLKDVWRGPEIYQFPKYIQNGGTVFPTDLFVQNFNRQS